MKPAVLPLLFCACALALAGCAATAPDISGRWKPVNRLAATTTAIALQQTYVYQVAPMDGTLKALLERWARDTGTPLAYRVDHDFTLVAAIADLRTADLATALRQLEQAYAPQRLSIRSDGQRLHVDAGTPGAAP